MRYPECGHAIDLMNESQPVCPSCGAEPFSTSGDSGLDLDEYEDVNEPAISFVDLPEEVNKS